MSTAIALIAAVFTAAFFNDYIKTNRNEKKRQKYRKYQ